MIARFSTGSRALNANHPEWWVGAVSGLAWCVLLASAWPGAGHAHHEMAPNYWQQFGHWMLMMAAMMLPLILESARIAAVRSFWWRRHRAIALFVTGYLLVWLLLGIPVALLPPSPLLAAASLMVAAAWFLVPVKRRLRLGCHLTIPMEPSGWRADRDCIHFGWKIGVRCAGNCGVLMVACAALGHVVIGMVLIAALTLLERVRPLNAGAVAATLLITSVGIATL